MLFGINNSVESRKNIIKGYKAVRDIDINPHFIEPYFVLGVVLYIAGQYERAPEWDWFNSAVDRWRRDVFEPFAAGQDLFLACA